MPDKTYTSQEVAMLLEHLRGKNDPKDNVRYSPEEIDALIGSAAGPTPPPLGPGERVMDSSPQGLPPGSRVVSMPTQVYEPRPVDGPMTMDPMHLQDHPGAAPDPRIQKRDALFEARAADRAGRNARAAYGSENWQVQPLGPDPRWDVQPLPQPDPIRTQMVQAVDAGDVNRYDQLDAVRRGDVAAYDQLDSVRRGIGATYEAMQAPQPSVYAQQMDSVRHSDAMWEEKQRSGRNPTEGERGRAAFGRNPTALEWLMSRGQK